MWANLDSPITSKSVGQWRKGLRSYELRLVEREAGPLLGDLGYDPSRQDESTSGDLNAIVYRIWAATRYCLATLAICLMWLIATGGDGVPLKVILGNTVRAHLPFERFRDRFGYRL